MTTREIVIVMCGVLWMAAGYWMGYRDGRRRR